LNVAVATKQAEADKAGLGSGLRKARRHIHRRRRHRVGVLVEAVFQSWRERDLYVNERGYSWRRSCRSVVGFE
jgi:hypothetical protein